jgi:hypothetical protein
MARKITKCPECGAALQASIKVYLSDIVVKDGKVIHYNVDSELLQNTEDFSEAVGEMIDTAEGDELQVYCENDHNLEL